MLKLRGVTESLVYYDTRHSAKTINNNSFIYSVILNVFEFIAKL